jgi:hypothetical protein
MSRQCLLVAIALLAACSDSTPPETPREHAQATIGTAGGTLVTPSGAAGVTIPAGTFSQPVTVTVTELATPPTPGTGPLPTNLPQYGPFYDFTTSPQVAQFGDSARVGVCQVTNPSDPLYPPEPHDRLRLAHTVNGQLEILDRVDVTDFLHCSNVSATTPKSGLSKIASDIGHFFRPTPLYAAHGGLGGKVKSFSPFGAVLDACADTTALAVGVTASGTIALSDCAMLDLGPVAVSGDLFKFSLGNQSILHVTTTGAAELLLRTEQINNQARAENLVSEIPVQQSEYVILPAGNYAMTMHNRSQGDAAERTPYTFTMQTVAAITGCPINQSQQQTYVFPGIVYNGSVATDDCPTIVQGLYGDLYWTWMVPGRTYQISATASTGLRLDLSLCCSSTIPVRSASASSGTVTLTFQPSSAGLYVIDVTGNTPPAPVSPYTLTLTKQ